MNKRALTICTVAFLGMVNAFYLSAKRGEIIPCFIVRGCEKVLSSTYSIVGGIPLAWIGLVFYISVFSLAVFQLCGARTTIKWVSILALPALVISLFLVWIQAFVLQAFCAYCLLSAVLVISINALCFVPRRRA